MATRKWGDAEHPGSRKESCCWHPWDMVPPSRHTVEYSTAVLLLHKSWAHEWQNRAAGTGWKISLNWWHSRSQGCERCCPAWLQPRSASLSPSLSLYHLLYDSSISEMSQGASYELHHHTDASLRVKRILYLGALKPTRPEHSTLEGWYWPEETRWRSQKGKKDRKITECGKQKAASTHSLWYPATDEQHGAWPWR